jgi:hypothetical protein
MHMKALATLALFLLLALPAKADEPYVREFVQDIEMSKDDLYNNSLLWMAQTFRSSKDVIDLKDRESGVIVETMVGRDGFEPSTYGLKVRSSTTELTTHRAPRDRRGRAFYPMAPST